MVLFHNLREDNPGRPAKLKMEENLDFVKHHFEKKPRRVSEEDMPSFKHPSNILLENSSIFLKSPST